MKHKITITTIDKGSAELPVRRTVEGELVTLPQIAAGEVVARMVLEDGSEIDVHSRGGTVPWRCTETVYPVGHPYYPEGAVFRA